ncbi:MAG: nicotinamide riboside transporter PnuC [Chitinophagia bacterium]|nr:nicotinamide riboside transporter PnuC [Chitinophagia bacterium]
METYLQQIWQGLLDTGWLEAVAVVAGIASVWYSRRANVLVYPVGLVNTVIYIWLSLEGQLYGEASVNLYYTVVSLYGWFVWTRKDEQKKTILQIRYSTGREWGWQIGFFLLCFVLIFACLAWLKKGFAPGAIPWADALASASAYTGMWLMARKKVESWYWWILTDMVSVPLYTVKGYAFTGLYYLILLFMAVSGLLEWQRKALRTSHD